MLIFLSSVWRLLFRIPSSTNILDCLNSSWPFSKELNACLIQVKESRVKKVQNLGVYIYTVLAIHVKLIMFPSGHLLITTLIFWGRSLRVPATHCQQEAMLQQLGYLDTEKSLFKTDIDKVCCFTDKNGRKIFTDLNYKWIDFFLFSFFFLPIGSQQQQQSCDETDGNSFKPFNVLRYKSLWSENT